MGLSTWSGYHGLSALMWLAPGRSARRRQALAYSTHFSCLTACPSWSMSTRNHSINIPFVSRQREILVSVFVVASLAGVVHGGPLDPPGPPASTLPQVEPR